MEMLLPHCLIRELMPSALFDKGIDAFRTVWYGDAAALFGMEMLPHCLVVLWDLAGFNRDLAGLWSKDVPSARNREGEGSPSL